MSEVMKVKIKPKNDFIEVETGRLFLVGRYYTVKKELAEKFHKDGKCYIQQVWQEGDIKCSTYR